MTTEGIRLNMVLAVTLLAAAGAVLHASPGETTNRESPVEIAGERGKPTMEILQIGNEVFYIEVAQTPEEHQRGLMWRREIPADGGMLFVFPEEQQRQFWMANTRVDLDLIFLDAKGRVVALHTMRTEAPKSASESDPDYFERLPTYASGMPARFAIEFKAGTLPLLKLSVGDPVPIDLERWTE